MINFLSNLFRCSACQARDMHIMTLKEELRDLREFYSREVRVQHDDLNDVVKHITGMNRAQSSSGSSPSDLKVVQRNTGIAGRIAHAERLDKEKAEPIKAARDREYRERIDQLLKPETELVTDAVQKSGTE